MLQLHITVGLKRMLSTLGIYSTKINRSNNKYHRQYDHQQEMTHEYNQHWSKYILSVTT
jgi:hypothetical protein